MHPVIKRAVIFGFMPSAILKPISVFLMGLLLFLTVLNYFVYGGERDKLDIAGVVVSADDEQSATPAANPAGPDEKSPDAPISVNEEFIHKHTELTNPFWTNYYFRYLVADAEKLHVTHFEILSPPPDSLV